MKSKKNTHGRWKTWQSTYPDDSIELCHGHLFGSLHSLDDLLLMLQNTDTGLFGVIVFVFFQRTQKVQVYQ